MLTSYDFVESYHFGYVVHTSILFSLFNFLEEICIMLHKVVLEY